MNLAPRVLIVDPSAESREVLRTLLERRGATTIEARRPDQAIRLAAEHRPDLILFDAENVGGDSAQAADDLAASAGRSRTPIVIFGTAPGRREPAEGSQFVSKPYHYGPLIRRIDDLLDAA